MFRTEFIDEFMIYLNGSQPARLEQWLCEFKYAVYNFRSETPMKIF
jgi:hypothetical protein